MQNFYQFVLLFFILQIINISFNKIQIFQFILYDKNLLAKRVK